MLHSETHSEIVFIKAGNPEASIGCVLIRLAGPTYVKENSEQKCDFQ